jgi:hypothetical protein
VEEGLGEDPPFAVDPLAAGDDAEPAGIESLPFRPADDRELPVA